MNTWVSILTSITMVILALVLFDEDSDDDQDGGMLIPAYQQSEK